MFCNNVAAPVLCFFLITPVLHRIQDRKYCCAMVMGIAFACNIGGMPTPIASPQNAAAKTAITQEGTDVSFTKWLLFTLPFCIPLLLITWLVMIWFWKPELKTLPDLKLAKFGRMTWKHYYVTFITTFTIVLWCTFQFTSSFFGRLGLIGLIPVIGLYGPAILPTEDFKRLDWNILMLLGGGASLGDAVKSSGLLATLANKISEVFGTEGQSTTTLWLEFMFFSLVVVVLANFISHTVAAITMMPVVAKVGAMSSPKQTVNFVLGSVLMDSAACALPVSSFPNVIAYGVTDADGQQYLQVSDYLKASVIIETTALICMASIGWGMVQVIH